MARHKATRTAVLSGAAVRLSSMVLSPIAISSILAALTPLSVRRGVACVKSILSIFSGKAVSWQARKRTANQLIRTPFFRQELVDPPQRFQRAER